MDDGTRTRDDRHHKPGLYQLSYAHHYFLIISRLKPLLQVFYSRLKPLLQIFYSQLKPLLQIFYSRLKPLLQY